MKRAGSSKHHFVRRIPADVREAATGRKLAVPLGSTTALITITAATQSVRFSLRTEDRHEARLREAQAAAYLEHVWSALRQGFPVPLTHRQAVALAGELYAAWTDATKTRTMGVELQPDGSWRQLSPIEAEADAGGWESVAEFMAGVEEDPEKVLGPVVDRLLLRKGIGKVDAMSREMVLREFAMALRDAAKLWARHAASDYTPDTTVTRFPQWEDTPGETPKADRMQEVFDGWWREAKAANRAEATRKLYAIAWKRLEAYVEHDNVRRIVPADVVNYKDKRLAEGRALKSISTELVALKSILAWAVGNGILKENPAAGIRVATKRKHKVRPKGYTEAEANVILAHAKAYTKRRKQEPEHVAASKRWMPWLCAYTGARVGEIAQLRKEDVREEADGVWTILITPEAGTVKNKEARTVVLHAHLVEMGFPDFVKRCNPGHIFMRVSDKGALVARTSAGLRISTFTREVVKVDGIQPNHAWRHAFKTRGRQAGIQDSVLDWICGHAPSTIGQAYGDVTIETQRQAMDNFPRFSA